MQLNGYKKQGNNRRKRQVKLLGVTLPDDFTFINNGTIKIENLGELLMAKSNIILDDLYKVIKSISGNPITKLDEVNTILHIYTIKREIKNIKDEKLLKDYHWLLSELEQHYQDLQRKNSTRLTYEEYEQSLKVPNY